MVCTSGSVQSVADKTVAAQHAVDQLAATLQQEDDRNKQLFFEAISEHLSSADIADAREIGYNSDIKTEYVSEFSLDKIAEVVTSALKAAIAASDPTALPKAATSTDAINAYVDVVNSVAEAAKSTSTSAASLSFSMNRLSPGMFAFLRATSVNLTDVDTFGEEAVTSTAIYYRFMQSIDDIKNQAKFGEAIIDAKNLINMKTLQAALTDQLADGSISIDVWTTKDAAFTKAVQTIQARLDADKFTHRTLELTARDGFGAPVEHSFEEGSPASQELVQNALERLRSGDAEANMIAIETSEARLADGYY